MRRVIASALALALALTVAACGAVTTADDEQTEGQRITTAQVVREFQQAPGQPKLRQTAGGDESWEQLGLGLNISEKLRKRYGVFNVYVVKPGKSEAVQSLLRDKETKKALKRGGDGVYWEYDTLSRSYVAYKRYGANVVVAWWNERKAPGIDARWTRIDGLLSGLETG